MDTPRFYFTDTFREFRPLLEKYSTKKKRFEKGSMIFSSAKPLDFCLYIDSGLISYSVLHESGAEKTLFYHGVGNLFPTYQSPRQYKICELGRCLTRVEAMVIPQTNLKRLMQTNLDFDRNVLDHYVEMFNFMIYDSIHQCHSSAYVRLCNFFSIYLENRSQEKVKGNEILLTQEELARIIGVSRVQIGTILNRLRNQKIIETDRRKVIVKDTALLIEQCTEEAYTD